ncbi:MAG: pectate lyase, partial [Lewinella sp.]|nr:pectate lyase [Lewinella sp.]
ANENTTVQWCLISESLNTSVHSSGSHGYGGIWGGKQASFHHNLLAHHNSRNPRLGETAGTTFALTDLVDLRNNVIYNWMGNSCYGGEGMNVNIVNCYYKPGPATPSSKSERIISIDKNKVPEAEIYDIWGRFFIDGNYVEGSARATNDNWTYGVYNQFHSSYGTVSQADKDAMRLDEAHPINGNVTTHTPQVAYEKVLDIVGASFVRDPIDIRIIDEVTNTTFTYPGSNGSNNGIIDSHTDVGGFPELTSTAAPQDTSGDGMPDDWKTANGLDPDADETNGHDLSTGYENIEVYINSLVKDIVAKQQ